MNQSKRQLYVGLFLLLLTPCVLAEETAFTIKGDSSSWDIPNNQMRYFGNARFSYQNLLIEGNELIARKSVDGNNSIIEVSGEPARFNETQQATDQYTNLNATTIFYFVDAKKITANGNVHLMQKNERQETVDIKGDSLSISQAESYRLSVTGSPLKLSIVRVGQQPIQAQASELHFDKQKETFEMIGSVVLTSLRETMRAEKVLFNMKTGILEVPKSPNSQVEIIQSQKKR